MPHFRTCSLCEAICGLEIELENGQVSSIRGDAQDPFSRGHLCPKAVALQDLQADPDRLRQPLRRTATGWQTVSWAEALEETVRRLRQVQQAHGRNSVASYFGNPMVHNYAALMFGTFFRQALGSRSRFSATSVDQLPHQLVAYLMYGHQLLVPIPDLDRTDFWLILGGNPAVSNGSLMTAPDVVKRLKAIRERGGEVVVVDPRRSETARLASRHHFIRPGSDVLLMLSLLHTLFAENLAMQPPHSEGWEKLPGLFREFPPERVAPLTGLAADDIAELARRFAGARSAVCYGRVGVSTQSFGSLTQWLIQLLNLVTGNLDRAGGAMFTKPAVDVVSKAWRGGFGRGRSRVRGLPEFSGELPVATLAEEILMPGKGQLKALVTAAGNPVLSTPNGRQLEGALEQLDFMVSIDPYLNETTRHAHLILPPTPPLEHDHYDLIFNVLAIRNTARYSGALFTSPPEARHEWEIFADLSARLSGKRLRWAVLRRLGPRFLLDLGLRFGPYGGGLKFWKGLTLKRLEAHPHGLDLGPLQPALPKRLFRKAIQLVPEVLQQDLARAEALLGQEPPTLVLVGRRQLRSNNSWMHNFARLVKGKDPCTLLIHPQDAGPRRSGDKARLRSRVGELEVTLEVSEEMMPGVVSLPHGWGHTREGTRQQVAREHAGASHNDLTDDLQVDPVSGNAAFSGVSVELISS